MSRQQTNLFRIPPYFFIHVLDQNANVTRVEQGPLTFIRQDHEKVVFGPEKMVQIPPQHYVVVENPVKRDADGEVVIDPQTKQAKLRHSEKEVRLSQEPFILYPEERLLGAIRPLTVVPRNSALRLRARCDVEAQQEQRRAGDEWLFKGPATYIANVDVEHVETCEAVVIRPNQALKLVARKDCTDQTGQKRVTGEEWIVGTPGAYLPGVYADVVDLIQAQVLTEKKALHLRAARSFQDKFGKQRKSGEEWLVTNAMAETHITSVFEILVGVVNITTLDSRQFCVVCDPIDDKTGKNQLGKRKLVVGPASFFLRPHEHLEQGIQNVFVLVEDEGLVLQARELFTDKSDKKSEIQIERRPGDQWLIRGPCEYVPPVEAEVLETRKAVPLDKNEGIYVRDHRSGEVRAVVGQTYMLNEHEELWDKELPSAVEALIEVDALANRTVASQSSSRNKSRTGRDKTRVVMYRVPHNAVCQLYDYKSKTPRVIFGPDLVQLGPDEQFTELSLSGGKPKRPNCIRSLCLLLGPDFMTDVIVVETSDHARLELRLSYSWQFRVDKHDKQDASKLFSVPDFVGDACKAVASRIRGAVASVRFDDFHKNSARLIRSSVFGIDQETGKVRDEFIFKSNNLIITSIDVQSVEPVDEHTRISLQKSVQLAIQITTDAQAATATQEANRLAQEAEGLLERQKIQDKAENEKSRCALLELEAKSAAVQSTGVSRAEAQSRAEAAEIQGTAAVKQAKLRQQAEAIRRQADIDHMQKEHEMEVAFLKDKNELEISRVKDLADIEASKFAALVQAIGADTLKAMAQAGPEMQAKLLGSLGIQSTLITDGKSPINLFQTASGLINTQPQ